MRLLPLAGLSLISTLFGCEQVFGTKTLDAAAIDAPPDVDCTQRTVAASASQSVTISSEVAYVQAVHDHAWIDSRAVRRTLWKFAIPAAVLGHQIVAARMMLPFVGNHRQCGTSALCGDPCGVLEQAGTIDVYPLDVTWEPTASWDCKRNVGGAPCIPWDGPAGTGGESGAPRVGQGDHQVGMATTVVIDDLVGATALGTGGQFGLMTRAADETGMGAIAITSGTQTQGGACLVHVPTVVEFDYCVD